MNKKIIIGAVVGACVAALIGGAFFMLRKPTVKQLVASNAILVKRLEDGKITSASADVSAKLGIDLNELEGIYDDTSVAVEASGNGAIDGTDAHIKMKAKAKALGEKVISSLKPGEVLVKIVYDELVKVLGAETAELKCKAVPTVVMLVGLQGAGKRCSRSPSPRVRSRPTTTILNCW